MRLLYKPAKPDINAFNETVTLAEIGCDTFGPRAWVELRPFSQAPGAVRFRANIANIWKDTWAFIQYTAAVGPMEDALDPAHILVDHPTAEGLNVIYHPMMPSYVARFGDIKILAHPATQEDVEAAAAAAFAVIMPKVRRAEIPEDYIPGDEDSGEAGKVVARKTEWAVADREIREFPGFDLAVGSDELPFSEANMWKVVELDPSLSGKIANWCLQSENFPKLTDPMKPSTSGAAGVSTTSTNARPRNGAKKTRKPGGRRRSSPKQPTN